MTLFKSSPQGKVYVARRRPGYRPRARNFSRRFEARIFGETLNLETRPGIFSHGRLDQGTLALSEVARLEEADRLIDLGCGAGAVGIGAARASPRRRALLVDSSLRAIETARGNIRRNGTANAALLLGYDLAALRGQCADKVLANPPYFSNYRIATLFAAEAKRALVKGGELYLVTKSPARHAEILQALFGNCQGKERRGYTVLWARKN